MTMPLHTLSDDRASRDVQHQRPVRRFEVETDDIDDLLYKVLVVRQLERLGQMRLETVRAPDSLDTAGPWCGRSNGLRSAASCEASCAPPQRSSPPSGACGAADGWRPKARRRPWRDRGFWTSARSYCLNGATIRLSVSSRPERLPPLRGVAPCRSRLGAMPRRWSNPSASRRQRADRRSAV